MVCGICEGSAPEVKKVDGVAVVLKDYSERRTTDSIYFLVLLAAWACMTIVGIVAGKNGDPNLLIAPYSDNVSVHCLIILSFAFVFFKRRKLFDLIDI